MVYEDLKELIKTCGIARYRIAQDTGVPESCLSRFVNGISALKIEHAERVANYLGYKIMLRRKRGRRRGGP
ncbi:MAG: helix-turn-helix transcriptional regulator [Phycisphaerales bacterium]|nr:helix-turn-helix transcriptional regulator [Phycisphaerales bacterium]